jgi:hypothetical protein
MQTVKSRDFSSTIITKGDYVELGSYADFVFLKDISTKVDFLFRWTSDEYFKYFLLDEIMKERKLKLRGLQVSLMALYGKEIVLDSLKYFGEEKEDLMSIKRGSKGGYTVTINLPGFPPVISISKKNYKPEKFYLLDIGKLSSILYKGKIRFISFNKNIYSSFESRVNSTKYLGPLREYPNRFYVTTGEIPEDVGFKGEKTVGILRIDYRAKNSLLKKLSYWLKSLDIAEEAVLDKIKGEQYQLLIIDKNSKVQVNIQDTGFGVSQVLPVIVESIYAQRKSTILIEQPEIHLNPLVQANLSDLFIELTKDQNHQKQFIIETHSEHIINRIRRRIADDTIKNEDVNIFYFYKENGECKIRTLTINDFGQIEDWPEGFFEEEYRDMDAQMKAIFKKTGDE